ncbi:MAG: hypothetical protein K2Y21_07335 [Phycisphaerales bacterium]|nr:hypothetical protein [Phycisphaerales bacterium]
MGSIDTSRYRRRQRRLLGSSGFFIGLAAIGVLWFLAFGGNVSWSEPEYSVSFRSEQWRATPATLARSSIRLRMVNDLLKNHSPLGLHRDNVVSLLGPPDDTPYFRNYDMVYLLGPERGFFSVDSEWLILKLTPDGRVSEAKLVTD